MGTDETHKQNVRDIWDIIYTGYIYYDTRNYYKMCRKVERQHTHTHTHTHIYIYIYIHTHIYIYARCGKHG